MTHRRVDDHVHPQYWGAEDHHRFESRMAKELERLREDVEQLTMRLTLMLGAIAILAFIIPILAPFLTAWAGVDTPTGQ